MKCILTQIASKCLVFSCSVLLSLLLPPSTASQTNDYATQPVVVSAQTENAMLVYKVNGKRVEDSRKNSLLTNLGKIQDARGDNVPVFIVIDVRASFSEAGKLETALDKVGLMNYRLFVSNFSDGTMNEIHWDESAIPIPRT
jgi:biopolymer transport protein ExbD